MRVTRAATLALLISVSRADEPQEGLNVYERPELQAEFGVRLMRIRAELATLRGHPWAGEYVAGDGLGANLFLAIAPSEGFVFQWTGCLGIYALNWGAALEAPTAIELRPELARGDLDLPPRMLHVTWGARSYLIEPEELVDLCNAFNDGHEPRRHVLGGTLLRKGDERRPAPGRPHLHGSIVSCALEEPLQAHLVAVGPERLRRDSIGTTDHLFEVRLDAGRAEGVVADMRFHVVQPRSWNSFTVSSVEEHTSTGTLVRSEYDKPPPPSVGWEVSTRDDRRPP